MKIHVDYPVYCDVEVYNYEDVANKMLYEIVPDAYNLYVTKVGEFKVNEFRNNKIPYPASSSLANYEFSDSSLILVLKGDTYHMFGGQYIIGTPVFMNRMYSFPDLEMESVKDAVTYY